MWGSMLVVLALGAPTEVHGETLAVAEPSFIYVDLSQVPPQVPWQPGDPIRVIPRRHAFDPVLAANPPRPVNPVPPGDPLAAATWQPRVAKALNVPIRNFDGQAFIGGFPPDTVGDVGMDHYIQSTNGGQGASYIIFDKNTGAVVAGPLAMSQLSGVAGACRDNPAGDPIVLYDEMAQRWVLTEFTAQGPNRLCVYVSQTSDPVSGGWFSYSFQAPNFPDYPKYGVWPDAYYATTNEDTGPAVYALERNAMLLGQSARMQRFALPALGGFGFQALTPADHDGGQPPPAGAPGLLLRHRDDEVHNAGGNNPGSDFIELYEITIDWNNANNSILDGPTNIAVNEFDSTLCGTTGFECFPQPGTAVTLDPLREVLMWRVQYRNFGTTETLLANLTTDLGADRGGIRFIELRRTGSLQAPWNVFQQGTLGPADGASRWMGSAALDASGNMALGYSVSSGALFPSLRYTGRLSTDPAGTLTAGEIPIIAGTASQTDAERWGDYSSLNVDPEDGCTFWFTAEYTPSRLWTTRIAAFSFDECGAAGYMLSGSNLSQAVCTAAGATSLDPITISVTGIGGFTDNVNLSFDPALPAGFSGTIMPTSAAPGGTATAGIDVGVGAASGTAQLSIEGSHPQAGTQSLMVNVAVTSAAPAAVTLASPADGATDVLFTPTFSWNAVAGAEQYRFELATDAGFASLVEDRVIAGTSVQPNVALAQGTDYFWRVTARNSCGDGTTSAVSTFLTAVTMGDCPSGTTESMVFSDDMESGAPDWATADWLLQSVISNSGSSAWEIEQIADLGYFSLASPFVTLPANANPIKLRYFSQRNIEEGFSDCFDGGLLEYTVDDENIFQLPAENFEADAYNGTISSDFLNPAEGSDAWCGTTTGFVETVVDVSSLAGLNLSFYWTLAADESFGTDDSWIVDDVEITACLPTGIPAGELIFESSFEAGEAITRQPLRARMREAESRTLRSGQ